MNGWAIFRGSGATAETATGTGALPGKVPAGRPMAVWGGRTGKRAFESCYAIGTIMNEESKCDCQHCGGHIAFTPAQVGQAAICPHCSKETVLNPPALQSPKFFIWQNEQQEGPFSQEAIQTMISTRQITGETLLCPEDGGLDWTPAKELFLQDSTPTIWDTTATDMAEQALEHDDGCSVEIKLCSGAELKIKAVRLYDQISLAEINSLRATAIKNLHGVSTGLGSIGSLEWVLASSVVIGAVEGFLSAGAEATGQDQLAEVIKLEQMLRKSGAFLPVAKIENIETPIPGIWRVYYKRQKKIESGKTFLGEKKFETHKIQSAYIHSGEDFVTVQTDDGSVRSIRWSTVESYAYRK